MDEPSLAIAGASGHVRARLATLLPGALAVGGAAPAPRTSIGEMRPDVALLDKGDLGIATYAMLFVIVALLIDRFFDRRAINRLADALDRATKADTEKSTAILVQMARTESVMGRLERALGSAGE